jgi:hypothetical protein
VNPRAGLHNVEKRKFLTLPGLELRPLGHSARIPSLYRLHNWVLILIINVNGDVAPVLKHHAVKVYEE